MKAGGCDCDLCQQARPHVRGAPAPAAPRRTRRAARAGSPAATLPMIAPAVVATVFIRLMDALRTVDEVWMLTGGGPGSATRFVGVHIFKEVFPKTNYGYGSTISVVVLYRLLISGKSSSLIKALNLSEPPTTGAISLSFATSVKPVKSLLR